MFNKVVLVGNLTRDIELRYTQGGLAIAKTGIAINRKFKGQDGQQKEEVMFVDITFFSRSAEVANQYLRKSSRILVEGRLVLDQWVDNNGQKRSKHSVTVETMQMLDNKQDNQQQNNNYQQPQQEPPINYQNAQGHSISEEQYNQGQQTIPEVDIDDSEIPFN